MTNTHTKPFIRKLGTIDCGLVEATPVVFGGKLYRFEYVREPHFYPPNTTGTSYFRFVDVETGAATPGFAAGYHLGSAFVDGDTAYAFGVPLWGQDRTQVFCSTDLVNWSDRTALSLPGWGIYNTSVCKGPDRYIMAFEVGEPEELVGKRFTNFFAASKDCLNWNLLPPEDHVFTRDRYSACPAIRYFAKHYYMIYLEAVPHPEDDAAFVPYIVRTTDLVHWESSPLNPVMEYSDDDRQIANPNLTNEQRKGIRTAYNRNNSDVDLCEYNGRVVIYYSWGSQRGTEHLAEARYDGSLERFVKGFFP